MNSITVEGSLKMVISPAKHYNESTMFIPSYIANSIKVPHICNGIVITSPIEDCDYVIVVRQPVLWHGGIRSCKICVRNKQTNSAHKWNTISSM